MHTAHKNWNTSRVSKLSSDWLNYTGFPGDVCVVFFNVPREKKRWCNAKPPQERRRPSCLQLWRWVLIRNAEFLKVCEILKVCGIESFKFVREFYTLVCYYGNISTHWNVPLNKLTVIGCIDMLVKRHHGWALVNESCHAFQTFSHQYEGLATQDL